MLKWDTASFSSCWSWCRTNSHFCLLPLCHLAFHHDDNGQDLWTPSKPQWNVFLYEKCMVMVSLQQDTDWDSPICPWLLDSNLPAPCSPFFLTPELRPLILTFLSTFPTIISILPSPDSWLLILFCDLLSLTRFTCVIIGSEIFTGA